MSAPASFTLRGRNPDVLTCIANLSNDEVFTPPEFANRMLDTLAGTDVPADDLRRVGRGRRSIRALHPPGGRRIIPSGRSATEGF